MSLLGPFARGLAGRPKVHDEIAELRYIVWVTYVTEAVAGLTRFSMVESRPCVRLMTWHSPVRGTHPTRRR